MIVSIPFYIQKVSSDTQTPLTEGKNHINVQIRPTVPVLCQRRRRDDCVLPLTPIQTNLDNSPAVCSNGQTLDQVVMSTRATGCGIEIDKTTDTTSYNSEYYVKLKAATDGIYDGDHKVKVEFQTPKRHKDHPLWQGYVLTVLEVRKNFMFCYELCGICYDFL